MGLLVRFAEACGTDVGVDLSRHETLVAEQFLNAPDVSPAIEQVCGKTMTQGVGRRAHVQIRLLEVFFKHPGHAACRQAFAKFIEEHRTGLFF